MGKRKADAAFKDDIKDTDGIARSSPKPPTIPKKTQEFAFIKDSASASIQIVIGTYEKILHGLTASVRCSGKGITAEFADTFLFNAHTSAVRCLAISPPSEKGNKVLLASGGSDQIVNLYSLSTQAPSAGAISQPSLTGTKIRENLKNHEIGSLQHHAGSVTALAFPSKSKLLSAATDNTIAVARTHDWTILSTIKAPRPHFHGKASGDASQASMAPGGVNHLAIHPSKKLMITVGQGEKCMRLWNLVTGEKGGMLKFDRELLQSVGEGKHGKGEGLKVVWDPLGEEFVVAFERGCAVFGLDCKCKGRIMADGMPKIHQIRYLPTIVEDDGPGILAISTEDGRVLFYSTATPPKQVESFNNIESSIPIYFPFGDLGVAPERMQTRIKDFEVLADRAHQTYFVITASSDGAIRIWLVETKELRQAISSSKVGSATKTPSKPVNGTNGTGLELDDSSEDESASQDTECPEEDGTQSDSKIDQPTAVGFSIATHETGQRITCLGAFTMAESDTNGT